MREKLEKIIDAYEELEQKLGDPQILADQHEYNKLAKSYADQGPLVVAARKYVQDLNDLAEAKEMLSDAGYEGIRSGGDFPYRRRAPSA